MSAGRLAQLHPGDHYRGDYRCGCRDRSLAVKPCLITKKLTLPVTLEDIARALNVSKMTVSRAINNHPEISRATRALILATAQKMKYPPNQFARALTTNHS